MDDMASHTSRLCAAWPKVRHHIGSISRYSPRSAIWPRWPCWPT